MNKLSRFLAPVLMVGALAAQPAAASLVLDLNTGGAPVPCGTCGSNGAVFGWSFRVINAITINQIGVWDTGADGLGIASVQAGLWSANGALLASATVTDGSEQVASASVDGEWLFEDIATMVLQPGSYVIGSLFTSTVPLAQVGAPFAASADISLTGGVQSTLDGGFAFPGASFDFPIFGPSLRLAQAVPEPDSLALVGLGVVLLALRRRQRAANA